MKTVFQEVFLLVITMVIFNYTYPQTLSNSAVVSINLSIVGKGTPSICSDSSDYFFAKLNVVNTQDSTIKFWIMSCSWPADNWVISNKAVSLHFCGCDSNIPIEIILFPKKSVEFYTVIRNRNWAISPIRIKVGFLYAKNSKDIFKISNEKTKGEMIFWSNEVELKDNLFNYEIR